jgi:hypothetical protein
MRDRSVISSQKGPAKESRAFSVQKGRESVGGPASGKPFFAGL